MISITNMKIIKNEMGKLFIDRISFKIKNKQS